MIVFVRNNGEKQYRRANGGECPSTYPRNGWKKGQKYTSLGRLYIVDQVGVTKAGELRLQVTKLKDRKGI